MIGIVVVALCVMLPLGVAGPNLSLPTEVFIFAVFAMTYDLVFGYTGLISFGHALFVGAGGYAVASAVTQHGLPLWLGLVLAAVTGLVLATITGSLALRTKGVYFAMVTLAFAQGASTFAGNDVGNLTGGTNGEPVNGVPNWLVAPGNEIHLYYVMLAFLVVSFLVLKLFVGSPMGRVWQAVRDNEQRALMIGYEPFVYRLVSYMIAGTICSLAGAMYAIFIGYISPDNLSANVTIEMLLMVIIGGGGTLWGAIFGAAVLRYANHYLNELPTSGLLAHFPSWVQNTLGQPLLVLGVIYLLLIYFFPQGLAGLVQRRLRWLSSSPPPYVDGSHTPPTQVLEPVPVGIELAEEA